MIFNKKEKVILKLIDTCEQEKYRYLTNSYFKNTDAVLFVFSMNDKESFDLINDWIELFRNNNNKKEDIKKYLVGNKNDLEIKVDQSLIDEISRKIICHLYLQELKKKKIDELFEDIGKKLYLKFIIKEDLKQNKIKIKFKKKKQVFGC